MDDVLKKMWDSHKSFFEMVILLHAEGANASTIKHVQAKVAELNVQLVENRKMLNTKESEIDLAIRDSFVINKKLKEIKIKIPENNLQEIDQQEFIHENGDTTPGPRYQVCDELLTPGPSSNLAKMQVTSAYKSSQLQLSPSAYYSPSPNQYEEMEVAPTISYLHNEEFENVPAYMRGRLKLEAINEMVDLFNQVIDKKYDYLKCPRNTLKSSEKIFNMYPNWKLQQKDFNDEKICTENDIQLLANVKISKKEYSVITVLRHVKKIRQSKIKENIFYIVVDS